MKEGKGVEFTPNSIYKGDFLNNQKEGQGIFFKIDNAEKFIKYDGYWKEGKKYGEGKDYNDYKLLYEGSFKNGFYNGFGKYSNDSGIYEGEFLNNLLHGKGIFISNKGQKYEGYWKNDKKSGLFKIYDNNNKIIFEDDIEKLRKK